MRRAVFTLLVVSLFVQLLTKNSLHAADDKFGIGLKAGVNKLEGDWYTPRFNPMGSLLISYSPISYFAIGVEVNYSNLMTKESKDLHEVAHYLPVDQVDINEFQTVAMPIELDFKFNFLPRNTVNPFASLGFGGVNWESKYDGSTVVREGKEQKNFDLFFKTSGGLEFNFDNGLGLAIGADFRYTGVDLLDQRDTGDLNDGITSIWAGINYSFLKKDPLDLDRDNVTKRLDLDLYRPEDRNGFWDHDGKPDLGKPPKPTKAPTVIHYPVFQAEEGRDLRLTAVITSEIPIRTATVIYRTTGTQKWKLAPLKNMGDVYYEAVINGAYVTTAGIEYCVVAVDTDLKGIGYSGLPKRPIQVKVASSGRNWRIVSALVAFFGWGAATYIVMTKQN
ncbi:outer membrane beta-barrel protein [candidate division KSB1 bacterium]|nr:outer membrane beta-barrel protein [candidate division KSB1 bacterium]